MLTNSFEPGERPPRSASITLGVLYGRTDTPAIDTLTVTLSDSARYLEARSNERLRVAFRAHDAEGLKSLRMGAALLTTVGAGLESKRIPVEPVTSSCPRAELIGEWTSPPSDAGASIRIGVAAENWAGLRSSTEPVTIRLRQTRD